MRNHQISLKFDCLKHKSLMECKDLMFLFLIALFGLPTCHFLLNILFPKNLDVYLSDRSPYDYYCNELDR